MRQRRLNVCMMFVFPKKYQGDWWFPWAASLQVGIAARKTHRRLAGREVERDGSLRQKHKMSLLTLRPCPDQHQSSPWWDKYLLDVEAAGSERERNSWRAFDVSGPKVRLKNKRTYTASNHLSRAWQVCILRWFALIWCVGWRSKLAWATAAFNLAAMVVCN